MTRWAGWRLVVLPLLVVALGGCSQEKEPKLKETPGQPQLRPLLPGDRSQPEDKGVRK